MLNKYTELFNKSFEGLESLDIRYVPKKYMNPVKNYNRLVKPILKAVKSKFKKGLDFGCGCVGSSIIGRLHGIEIVGLDIPYGLDDSEEGNRNRLGKPASEISDKISVHFPIQKNLQKMGYSIIVRDTTIYPWEEFNDNEFDFVMAYFALSKEWTNHKDTLNFEGEIYKKRLEQLFRITKDGGRWFVHPKNHIISVLQHKNLMNKNIKIENWD